MIKKDIILSEQDIGSFFYSFLKREYKSDSDLQNYTRSPQRPIMTSSFPGGGTQIWVGYGSPAQSFNHYPITKPEKTKICNLSSEPFSYCIHVFAYFCYKVVFRLYDIVFLWISAFNEKVILGWLALIGSPSALYRSYLTLEMWHHEGSHMYTGKPVCTTHKYSTCPT